MNPTRFSFRLLLVVAAATALYLSAPSTLMAQVDDIERFRWPNLRDKTEIREIRAYKDTCYFNNQRRRCTVITWKGRTQPIKGSDIDILWEDGEVTTVKFLGPGPLAKGGKVLLNGSTPATNEGISLMNALNMIRIRSSTGNTIRFRWGD